MAEQIALSLAENNQEHVLKRWENLTEENRRLAIASLVEFEQNYPGGIKKYVNRAKDLLAASKAQTNPFEGLSVQEPDSKASIRFQSSAQHEEFEALGVRELHRTGFVLVAGGLGERLGYSGIKIALPVETVTGMCYLEFYIRTLLAYQQWSRGEFNDPSITIPLAIMTSGDTDLQTRELLAKNQNFGLPANQLFILKQPLVPAMTDNDGRFALEEDGSVQMKPHGHGDVHLLLHRSGTAARWKAAGVRWVVFFQDTNAMVFRCLSAALGVSAARELALNFVTVPRVPGEAVGAICRLTSPQGQSLTANVEYNEMEALLGGRPEPVHATADSETKSRGVSLFPGNINCFVVEASSYLQVLEDTEGLVGEFINPKYQPGSNRSVFAKPTRIESMMQDYAKLLSPSLHASGRVGHSQFDKWTAFSPVKNDPHSGATRQKQGIGTETASTGEADFYAYYRKLLAPAVKWEGSEIEVLFTGIRVALGARVVLAPSMTITRAHTLGHFQPRAPSAISITQRSVLVLDAPGIIVRHLELDGFLKITAPPGVQVVVDGLTVQNRGSSLVPIEELKGSFGEEAKIRGYVHITTESTAFHFGIPNGFGNIFVLNDQNKHIYLVSNSNL